MQFALTLSPLFQISATFCAASVIKYNYSFKTMHTKFVEWQKVIGIIILICT